MSRAVGPAADGLPERRLPTPIRLGSALGPAIRHARLGVLLIRMLDVERQDYVADVRASDRSLTGPRKHLLGDRGKRHGSNSLAADRFKFDERQTSGLAG
jgi:hypothetical protein